LALIIDGLIPIRRLRSAGGRELGQWSAAQFQSGINLASASSNPWEPGGPWHAQGQLLSSLTNIRDELDWTERDMAAFLQSHPEDESLRRETKAIEACVHELQRALARPVPIDYTLRRVSE
jgi:hypothetical protein